MAFSTQKRTRTILKRLRVVVKRTRASTAADWGEWAITTETPPYNNTTVVEYKLLGWYNYDVTTDAAPFISSDVVDYYAMNWESWADTVDVAPFVSTERVEYREANEYTSEVTPVVIDVAKLTNGEVVEVDDHYEWQGTGIFDVIMGAINGNIKAQYDSGRIVGQAYAATYMGGLKVGLGAAMQYLMAKDTSEASADSARLGVATAKYNADYMLPIARDKAQEEFDILEDTHKSKVDLAELQTEKLAADTSYVAEQEQQLINSVQYNNKIKALDSLADTYGTFGAGGLTFNKDMWEVYYGIVADLSGSDVPTSYTVSKVISTV